MLSLVARCRRGLRNRNFDKDFSNEQLIEDVAAKHIEELAFGVAAVQLQPLPDDAQIRGTGGRERLTVGEESVLAAKSVECDGLVVVVAVNLRSRQ